MRAAGQDAKTGGRARGGVLLGLWLALCGTAVQAASVYGPEQGLPGALVEAIERDDDGLLWIGTQDGLVRFDSHRFVPLDLTRGNAVPDRHVRRLLAVSGALYVSTAARLQRYDLQRQTLRPITLDGREIPGVWGLVRGADGWLFAGTDGGELLRWRDAGDAPARVERIALQGDEALPGIVDLARGRDALWAATLRGVFRLDPQTGRSSRLELPLPGIAHGAVHARSVHEAADGELWLGFWNDGLVRHDPASGRTRALRPGTPEAGALRSTSIYSFLETSRGLYIGTNRGVVMYRRDCDCLHGLNHPAWDAVDGRGVVVPDLAAEGHGVWAGVWGGGAVRFGATDEVIEHQVRVDGAADSLAHSMVYALHADRDGRLWIGTYGGGAQWVPRAARRPGQRWSLQAVPPGRSPVESQLIWSLDEHDGALVIGSGRGLRAWRDGVQRELAPELESVRSYLALGPEHALVGTMFGLYERDAQALRPLPLARGSGSQAAGTAVWSLASQAGETWVGTAQGLVRLDAQRREIARHAAGPGAADLPGAVVWTQRRDAQGRLWLGTSGGLVRAHAADGGWRFERHALPANFGSHSIVSLEFDRRGRLWLGTPQGLVRYDPSSGAAERFDRRDGLAGDQFNAHASANDGERLFFGSIGGVIAFDPERLVRPPAQLAPGVVRWRVGDGAWHAPSKAIALAHDHAPLQLELSARHFARPDEVRYAYRWVPLETDFTPLGDARSAVFSRLPSGRHRLELRASLEGDDTSAAVAQAFELDVAQAWFETLWGRAALLAALFALGWSVYLLRTRQTRRWAQGLAREVRERTRELTQARDALEVANRQLQRQVAVDPLTGLANRRALFERAAELEAGEVPLAAMLIDLDHFKAVNDRFGHQAGDAVLRDFASLLRDTLPEATLHARYGGEEFVCLFEATPVDELQACAARLLAAVRERRVALPDATPLAYRASIGLALALPGTRIDALLRRADAALYRAKQAGRDRSALADAAAPASEADALR